MTTPIIPNGYNLYSTRRMSSPLKLAYPKRIVGSVTEFRMLIPLTSHPHAYEMLPPPSRIPKWINFYSIMSAKHSDTDTMFLALNRAKLGQGP
jgi:hypothetical protein